MTTDFNEETATDAVVASLADTPDPRLREVMTSLVRHLHGFVRDVEPTQAEWEVAIGFLTDVGHLCDERRQEFILLSDVLGVSMLVDAINHRVPPGATESTVLGPFHVVESPLREHGADLSEAARPPSGARRCVVRGRVLGTDGAPLEGAAVDVWHADDDGWYDVQRDDRPDQHLRGLFTTGPDGGYWFRTILPAHYPIPDDGPVGALLERTGRHPWRPAHIHFVVDAPGHLPVTTHLFVDGSPYLDDDTVFGVKASLVRTPQPIEDAAEAEQLGVTLPCSLLEFDVVLAPETADR